jgi:hypothetical protein
MCTSMGWLKILSFETSTFASTSSMGDLPLCLLFVLFVAKLSKPVLNYFFSSRTWYPRLGNVIKMILSMHQCNQKWKT